MDERIKQIVLCSVIGVSAYVFIEFTLDLGRKMIKKFRVRRFFASAEKSAGKMEDGKFIAVEGKVGNIARRKGNYIDRSIILSEGNTTYYEDFLLFGNFSPTCLIQPYQKTKLKELSKHYLRNETEKSFFGKNIFYSKSPSVCEGDYVYIFGKINTNPSYILPEFKDYLNIKPYYINGRSFDDLKKECTTIAPILSSLIKLGMCSLILYIMYLAFGPSRIRVRERSNLICKECRLNPTNIMCEKCENIGEYCDECYLQLQKRIDDDEISLHSIKCAYCKDILDCVQRLTCSN